MPALPNTKHEIFAQEIAKGVFAEVAYEKAGYTPSAKNAQRLKCHDGVKARVQEIQAIACDNAGITVERILLEYERIAFADITQAVQWGEAMPTLIPDTEDFVLIQGVALKPSSELPKAVSAAISEVRRTKEGIAIKFHSKTEALKALGQHRGMFKEQVEVTGKLTLEALVLASMKVKLPQME